MLKCANDVGECQVLNLLDSMVEEKFENITPKKGGMFRFILAKVHYVETPRPHQQCSAPTSTAKYFAQVEASTL